MKDLRFSNLSVDREKVQIGFIVRQEVDNPAEGLWYRHRLYVFLGAIELVFEWEVREKADIHGFLNQLGIVWGEVEEEEDIFDMVRETFYRGGEKVAVCETYKHDDDIPF